MASPALAAVRALVEQERYGEAAERLIAAAATGDPDALFELAHWRVYGNIVRRDLAAARRLFRESAAAGRPEAALLHAGFLANGSGGPVDWPGAVATLEQASVRSEEARRQLALVSAMNCDGDGNPRRLPEKTEMRERPRIWAARSLLTESECAWLIARARPYLQPSVVVDPGTGEMVPNPVRRSDGAMFGVLLEDVLVSAINRRIAALSETKAECGEPLQLLRYPPGGEYKAHLDGLPPGGNQRVATVLVYLNESYEGGETTFLRTGTTFRGRTGDALLFWNVDADGAPDPMSLHAGLPVRRGEKLIATRWIRERTFTYPPPEPATGSRFD